MTQSNFTPQLHALYSTQQSKQFIQIETITQLAEKEYYIEYIEMKNHWSSGKVFGYLNERYLYKIIWQEGSTLFAREECIHGVLIKKIGDWYVWRTFEI